MCVEKTLTSPIVACHHIYVLWFVNGRLIHEVIREKRDLLFLYSMCIHYSNRRSQQESERRENEKTGQYCTYLAN